MYMKRIIAILLAMVLACVTIACRKEPSTPSKNEGTSTDNTYLPKDNKWLTFDSIEDLRFYLALGEDEREQAIHDRYKEKNFQYSEISVARQMELSKLINRAGLVAPQTNESFKTIKLEIEVRPWWVCFKYDNYGFEICYPSNEDSYNEYVNKYVIKKEVVELDRTDMDSEATIFVTTGWAPYIEFVRNDLIIRVSVYNTEDMPYRKVKKKLIQLANEIVIEDVSLNTD